ncbi:glycosyltransferase family 4 protein [Methanosarcina sp.]|uniref:glycosyltransferase family 4 protein n=1 Tax=Methanosarcina sp. TaxID=2213 RepID=UPI003BB4BEF7
MKILQITLDMKGGIVHYTAQLSNALSKHGEVFVITPFGAEDKLFDKSVNLIQLHTGNVLKNFFLNTFLINRFCLFLKTINLLNPDIIHIQFPHPWLCFFLPFLSKYKIVTTIHNVEPHIGSRSFDQNFAHNLHIKYSDALIVHGDLAKSELQNRLKESGLNKDIFVVPHGDYSFFTEISNNINYVENNTVLFFGRIVEYKGLNYLIEAASQIVKEIPNLKVIIAGSGKIENINVIEKLPYFEIFNYYIENEDVGEFFQRSSVVVLPYIESTQTGIIPIAYAFKKPVVVTNVGSIPEVVEDGITGYIVPPRDSKSLANAIIKVLKDNKLRIQMGENAYTKMKEELSWDVIAEKTINVYKQVTEVSSN